MGYRYIQNGDNVEYNIVQLVADEESDVESLPKTVAPGSACLVIDSGSVYMLNTKKEWKKI